jgi:PPK2 family polyphosphate:nucleotide phosphotransferase
MAAKKQHELFFKYLQSLRVKPDRKISLKKDFHTDVDQKMIDKEIGQDLLSMGIEKLSELQDKLYAHNQFNVLIVIQAMDAAGKDGAIKHVMTGLNPQGVNVTSFKTPTSEELEHDYLWRHYKALPGRGEIGIFNRSHYENVLITRVHPEYLLNENLPNIKSVSDVTPKFWKTRFRQIREFEKSLSENGTIILKFFLHVSKEEQKKRFIDRIDDPTKNWKFSPGDVEERKYWNEYQKCYEELLSETSTDYAPWYVLPADDKWFTRVCLAGIINTAFEQYDFSYPKVNAVQKAKLQEIKRQLLVS